MNAQLQHPHWPVIRQLAERLMGWPVSTSLNEHCLLQVEGRGHIMEFSRFPPSARTPDGGEWKPLESIGDAWMIVERLGWCIPKDWPKGGSND